MLRSSAGNFYNYFRPGAGELIRSAEPRRFLSLSLPPTPFPFLLRPPSYSIDLFFFLPLLSLYLHHHLAFLTTHGSWSSSHRPFLSDPFFFSFDFSLPSSTCVSFSVSRAIVSRTSRSRESPRMRRVSKHLGCISPALISLVRHYGNYRSAPVRSRPVATGESLHLSGATLPRMKPGDLGSRIPRRARPFSGSLRISRGTKRITYETLASLQELRRL